MGGVVLAHMAPLTMGEALGVVVRKHIATSKVGNRRGSVAAVVRAMQERGLKLSANTLARKLDGVPYPLDADELDAIAEVLGLDPVQLWEEAERERESLPMVARRARRDATEADGLDEAGEENQDLYPS